jgi:hypothetical protein
MNKFQAFIEKNHKYITILLLVLIFFRTCDSGSKSVAKKVKDLQEEISDVKANMATKNDLQIEGLKAEKRMIQSTDRKMLDVQRQSEIDREIKKLEEK